jgi:murein hydrolase activator
MRLSRKPFSGLLLVLIVMGMTIWVPSTVQGTETGFVRVMDLTMRSGPDQQTQPIKTLARGALVTVLAEKNGWLKIRHEGHTGYILNKPAFVRMFTAEVAGSAEAVAHTDTPSHRNRERIDAQLKTSSAQLAAIQAKEIALIDAVDQAEKQVNRKRQQVLAMDTDLGALENQILTEQARLEDIEARFTKKSAYAGQRVRALHQLNSLGTLPLLANAESWIDFLRRKAALSKIIEADWRLLDHLAANRKQREELLTELNQRRSEHQQLEKTLRRELADLTVRLAERTDLLAQIQGKASLEADFIKGLEAAAEALDTAITELAGPESAVPVREADPKREAGTAVAGASPQATGPKITQRPFIKLKGLLNLPVNGKIISSYGHYRDAQFKIMNFRSGVLIRADRGEPIHAVANGTTLFADWFKGYGNMLIIDHGDHYYTVYARLEALFKARGDSVDADEVIATVGETARPEGPGLHFEVRHYGKPVNPRAWLRTTDQAASDGKKGVKG